ncbi:MAG: sulfurtransferase, partial [Acidimicrobiia bacterium]|nr:sulfurtransferase [Acidimicrobiia bacterium]
FRNVSELAELFSWIDRSGDVIVYCTIGARACTAWFALTQLLGRQNVRVYDGSWAQWGLTASLPVDCG